MHNKTRYEWRPTEENRIELSVVGEKNQRKINIYGSLKSRTGAIQSVALFIPV